MSISASTYRRGRGQVKAAKRVNFYITGDVDDQIQGLADRFGITKSLVVELLVKRHEANEDILPENWPVKTQPTLEGVDGAMTAA